jgi:drug/metabolite transporter (DMT)-like permease
MGIPQITPANSPKQGALARPMNTAASHLGQGILLMVAAVSCFAAMDTGVRHIGGTVPVLMLLILRYLTQALLMAPALVLSGLGFRSPRPRFQVLRGALLLACSAITFIGLRYMPVAEYTAIAMLTPVLVTLFSVLLFKEHISLLRWALVLGAFAGALIIIRPGSGIFGWAVVWPLAGSCAYAGFQLVTSRFAAREDPFITHFWTGAVGALAVLPFWPLGLVDVVGTWQALPTGTLLLIGAIGLLGTGGHLLLILAFGRAPASKLMPLLYLQIAVAVLLGWLVLDHVPDGWAWLGMAVIAACGAATAVLNMRAAAVARRETSVVEADTTAD